MLEIFLKKCLDYGRGSENGGMGHQLLPQQLSQSNLLATDCRQVLVFKGAGWQTVVVRVEISLRNISGHPSHRIWL